MRGYLQLISVAIEEVAVFGSSQVPALRSHSTGEKKWEAVSFHRMN